METTNLLIKQQETLEMIARDVHFLVLIVFCSVLGYFIIVLLKDIIKGRKNKQ